MRRRRVLISGVVLILAGTACTSQVESPVVQSAQRHADNAATVMENMPAGTPAIDLAGRVIGKGLDDTIEVLSASGTGRHGEVVLRIAVTMNVGFGTVSTAVRCYHYALNYFTEPNEIRCPDLPPMAVPPMSVTTTTVS
jgi:hypothetical protein